MAMKSWPNGLGATASLFGDRLNFHTTGDVWFVDSVTGTDAASPAGLNEKAPLATLEQAVTNAASGDLVVLASTHDEEISSKISVSGKYLEILGSGQSGGIPSPTLTCNVQNDYAIDFAGSVCLISNVKFVTSTGGSQPKCLRISARSNANDCYFEAAEGAATLLGVAGTGGIIDGCTFICTATATAGANAMVLDGTIDLDIRECIFDAGAIGWLRGGCHHGWSANSTEFHGSHAASWF